MPPSGFTFVLALSAGTPGLHPPLHHRTASMNITLQPAAVAGGAGPLVSIHVPALSRSYRGLVDPTAALALEGTAAPHGPPVATLAWHVAADLRASLQAVDRLALVVPAGALVGGRTYTFQLLATDTGGGAGSAAVVVTANAPPTGGYVVVQPASGAASSTWLPWAGWLPWCWHAVA